MSKALIEVGTLRLTRRTRSLRVIKEAISIQNSELSKHLSCQSAGDHPYTLVRGMNHGI